MNKYTIAMGGGGGYGLLECGKHSEICDKGANTSGVWEKRDKQIIEQYLISETHVI